MSHKLACADFTFPLLSHDHSLDLIALLGFEGVDIGLFEGRSHLWPSREFSKLSRSARALGKKVDDRGLEIADVFLQMAPDFVPCAINHPQASRRRKARDWFVKALDYASEAGSRHVTILPGSRFDDEAADDSLQRCIDELSWRVETARASGLVLGVEAHLGSIVPTARAARRLVESVPGLTLTLDYTHFTRRGTRDSTVEPLIRYASHFHMRGARKGRLQCSFADSSIDYRRVLAVMKETGYAGYIGIEYVWMEWERCNEVDNLSETILFRDFFRSL